MAQAIVVAAFVLQQGKVLLTKRCDVDSVAPGRFHLPGGHVEEGEQPDEALRRELHEELSISVKVGWPFAAFAYTTEDGVHTIAIVYAVAIEAGAIRIDNTENVAMAWAAPEEVPFYLAPGDPLYQTVRMGFEYAASRQ